MRVTVVRPHDLGPTEASLWAKFQHASSVTLNPFLSFTFAQAIGRARANARVAVVETDGAIQAFLPFELGRWRIGMPMGYPMNDLQAVISRDVTIDVRAVVRKSKLRGWRFMAAPVEQEVLAPYHYAGAVNQAPFIDLSKGYDAYFGGRSKSLRDKTARQRRALQRKIGVISFEWDNSSPEHVRQLITWKGDRYAGMRHLFSYDSTARRILEELSVTRNEDCRGLVNMLSAGGRTIVIFLGLAGPAGLCGWFAAYDPDMSMFSPGTMILLATAEEADRRGIARFEFGYDYNAYKVRLTNASYPVAAGVVWTSRVEETTRSMYRRFLMSKFSRQSAAPVEAQ